MAVQSCRWQQVAGDRCLQVLWLLPALAAAHSSWSLCHAPGEVCKRVNRQQAERSHIGCSRTHPLSGKHPAVAEIEDTTCRGRQH